MGRADPGGIAAVPPVARVGMDGQRHVAAGHKVVPEAGHPGHGIHLSAVEELDGRVEGRVGGGCLRLDGQGQPGDIAQAAVVRLHVKESGGGAGRLHLLGGGAVIEGGIGQQNPPEVLLRFRCGCGLRRGHHHRGARSRRRLLLLEKGQIDFNAVGRVVDVGLEPQQSTHRHRQHDQQQDNQHFQKGADAAASVVGIVSVAPHRRPPSSRHSPGHA